MTFKYCPLCGKELGTTDCGDDGSTPYCENCRRPFFPFSYPCVICLCVTDNGEIVLIKQSYVSKNYVCVAGYIKEGETPEEAAVREVKEEIGLDASDISYLGSSFHSKSGNLMIGFLCRVKKSALKLSSEVDSADFFPAQKAAELLREGSIAHNMLIKYLNGGTK
ncbi:MAG: NAD(+) diphosphatase [Oscillospiraceae bacterium]